MKKVKIKLNKNRSPIKKTRRHMLCTILKANKSCVLKWVSLREDDFSVDKHTYFIDPKGSYINNDGILVCVYLEGASLPIHHGSVKYETIKAYDEKIKDNITGKEKTVHVPEQKRIENVKYDSSLIDMLLNRKLADVFTKVHLDVPNLFLSILLIVAVAVGFVNIGMWFT